MNTPEKMEPATRKVWEKVEQTKQSNSYRIGQLEKMGVGLETTHARVEHFMDKLTDIGVITEHQMMEIFLSWEESLSTQVDLAENMVKERMQEVNRERQAALSVVQKGGLVGPSGSPIHSTPRVTLPTNPDHSSVELDE